MSEGPASHVCLPYRRWWLPSLLVASSSHPDSGWLSWSWSWFAVACSAAAYLRGGATLSTTMMSPAGTGFGLTVVGISLGTTGCETVVVCRLRRAGRADGSRMCSMDIRSRGDWSQQILLDSSLSRRGECPCCAGEQAGTTSCPGPADVMPGGGVPRKAEHLDRQDSSKAAVGLPTN